MKLGLTLILIIGYWGRCRSYEARQSLYRNIYSKYEGDIYLAAMFSIRSANGEHGCGRIIDQDGLQVITAAVYGIEMVKKRLNIPLRIGLLSIDTCQDPTHGLEQSKDFMLFRSCDASKTYVCKDGDAPSVRDQYKSLQRIFGVFGAGNSDVSVMAAMYLRLVNLPQISYFSTSPELSDARAYPGFFRTIPSDQYTVKAIVQLLREYNYNLVLLVHDNSKYSDKTKSSFEDFVKSSNSDDSTICIAASVVITQESSYINLSSAVQRIIEHTNGTQQPRVVVTFFTQAVVEKVLAFVEVNQVLGLGELIWIGTDSWGGRKWPNVTNENPMMNNSITLIPRASKMDDFMTYYKTRLPSVEDYNPWLARKFENMCKCQYSNESLFIYPELMKMRKQRNDSNPCEPTERTCAVKVYKNSLQMPYIHYVMDGILAYGEIIQTLIGSACDGLNQSHCSDILWANKTFMNYTHIVTQMQHIQFIDSMNETFHFWDGRDGIPAYSLLYFNKSTNQWNIVGTYNHYNQDSKQFRFTVDKRFDAHLKQNNAVSPCSQSCQASQKRQYLLNKCCWHCLECSSLEIINKSKAGSDDVCVKCVTGTIPNPARSGCEDVKATKMSLDELGAIIIFFADLFGLLYCCFTFVVMIAYWNTPIIKAFGKETSSVILLGTVLSFTFSILLLCPPSDILCRLYWFSPGFCSTISYASILAKTNRIVRIFSMNWSSRTKASPKFVSPMSQISIIGFITLVEAIIVIIIIVFQKVETYQKLSEYKVEIMCTKMDAGNLVATFLIPILLLLASTFYAFQMRKSPDGFNETRNINFMNFANCVVLVTSLFLYQILNTYEAVYPLCLQMTLSAYGNLVGLFTPKIYLVICRPEKNTLDCVTARTRSRSTVSLSQPNTPMADINRGHVRCRKCNTLLNESTGSDQDSQVGTSSSRKSTNRSQTKVFFVEGDSRSRAQKYQDDASKGIIGEMNRSYDYDF